MRAVILWYQNKKKRNDKNIHHKRRPEIWPLWRKI